nr:hypothetical protein [Tanacetum cinerariifolium]
MLKYSMIFYRFIQNHLINHLIYLCLLMKKLCHSSMNSNAQEILKLSLNWSLITCINPGEHLQLSSTDLVELLWEDIAFHIDNHFSKETMPYPRFTKIINHFILQNKSISVRNRINLHTARDDSLLGTLKYVRKFKKLASPKLKTIPVSPKEPTKKPEKARKIFTSLIQVAQVMEQILNQGFSMSNNIRSLGDSGEEDDDDEDDSDDESDDDNNDDDGDYNDDEDKNDDGDDANSDRTELKRSKIPDLNQSNEEHEEEENIDERVHTPEDDELTNEEENANNAKEENEEKQDDAEELYKDVNVNLRKEDVEMTEGDKGGANQQNVSKESGFDQVEEDSHVTLTAVHDTQKNEGEAIDIIDTSVRAIIKEEVRTQLPQILPQVVLEFATPAVASLSEFELTKILIDKMEEHKSYLRVDYKRELYDEVFMLKTSRDDKEKDQDPSARSVQGTKRRKSSKDVESSRDPKSQVIQLITQECNRIKSLTRVTIRNNLMTRMLPRLPDWHYAEGKQYLFDLHKTLPLIPDRRGGQVIPQDYFIENDLEYMKGRSLSRQYSKSVTKKKAATYKVKWIEDMKLTNLMIDEHYDLNVALYTFRSDLRNKTAYTAYLDPQGVIYEDQNNKNRLLRTDELHKVSDGMLNSVQTALYDITSGIKMEYLPKRKWSGLDKRRARVMI